MTVFQCHLLSIYPWILPLWVDRFFFVLLDPNFSVLNWQEQLNSTISITQIHFDASEIYSTRLARDPLNQLIKWYIIHPRLGLKHRETRNYWESGQDRWYFKTFYKFDNEISFLQLVLGTKLDLFQHSFMW